MSENDIWSAEGLRKRNAESKAATEKAVEEAKNSKTDYQKWLTKGAWTLKETVLLFLGYDPNNADLLSEQIERDLRQKKDSTYLNTNPFSWDERFYLYTVLKPLHEEADRYIAGGKLPMLGKNELSWPLFSPLIIAKWLCETTPLKPMPELDKILFPKLEKNSSRKPDADQHKHTYQAYHDEQVALFCKGGEFPARAWTAEEAVIKKKMDDSDMSFERVSFQEARKKVLAYHPSLTKRGRGKKDIEDLKAYYLKQKTPI